jgi:hypothetical protein
MAINAQQLAILSRYFKLTAIKLREKGINPKLYVHSEQKAVKIQVAPKNKQFIKTK